MISEKRKEQPFVSIVIPTLNRKRDIIKCVYFIRGLDYPKKNIEIIIWDNGSTDGTQEEVRRIFVEMEKEGWKDLNIIKSNVNLGVYTSRDELFKRIDHKADYVLSLDDDVFLPCNSLTILIKSLQSHSEAGIIGPRTVYESRPGETAHGAGYVNLWVGRYSDIDTGSLVECDYVIGCCMLIKSEVVSKLKGFDRDYYTSHGEVDFCLRAKKKGYKILYDPGVIVRHNVAMGGTKTLERIYYLYRNKLLVIRKNASLLQKVSNLSLYTIFWVPKMIMDSMWFHRGIKLDEWLVMLKAVRHAIINRVGKVDI
ncbi:MAG: putative glycosyl transferase [Candidatus Scalindua rubra]|uniref:Putative glycosyl transferase n=1 Tax=Candidatus Scalindua rubra TaxID=1872076 RepID=A0A1E3X890_9BACT|nr:MAG: putative glycosyl transferase [Candidatus Scalindua rubra]